MRDFQLAAEQPALGVDLLDRKVDAVFPVVADGGPAAGQFGDVGELDWRPLRERGCGRHGGKQEPSKNPRSHFHPLFSLQQATL
ncbi:hypothetical protein V1286_006760 [Bradyrhizobium algeriense]|uniref:Uncharacterized protein n=1 Tax=Bradyrhizobium algeriense TaxID=634784 RepID=A0ABU8BKZ2_9BRAD